MPKLDITQGEFEFLENYGETWGADSKGSTPAAKGLRCMIEEHLARQHARNRDEHRLALRDLDR